MDKQLLFDFNDNNEELFEKIKRMYSNSISNEEDRKTLIKEIENILKKREKTYEYEVICDERNNPPTSLSKNILNLEVIYRDMLDTEYNKIIVFYRRYTQFPCIYSF